MSRNIFLRTLVFGVFVFTTLNAQELGPTDQTFNQTLLSWLSQKGLTGKILDVEKVYDEDGFIDHMRLVFQEDQPQGERTQPTIDLEVFQDANTETLKASILSKDLNTIANMHFDWVARTVVRYALNKISDYLGLPLKITTKDGLYRATFSPSRTTVTSRYRFQKLVVTYSVENLVINVGVELVGPKEYLIGEYAKSIVNADLRSLERGVFPGQSTEGSFDSSSLIRSFLKLDESFHEMPDELLMRPLQEDLSGGR